MQMCGYFNDCNERIELPSPAILKPIELWTGK
jgi:DNA-directed RNA polymerase III subunit RPC1